MKKILTLMSLLLLVVFVTGCIFGDDDKTSSSGSSALIGTWGNDLPPSFGPLLKLVMAPSFGLLLLRGVA